MGNYTPMMEQYFTIKDEYKNCIVFFRLGDFYEMFFEDALIAHKILDITLTGRDCGMQERAPMCGVPYHSASGYIAKLVENGYRVAICEQVEDPKATKTIVRREVTRIVTKGTVLDNALLDESKNNYIICLFENNLGVGLSAADLSCGQLFVTSFSHGENQKLIDEIARYSPSEIIVSNNISCSGRLFEIFGIKPQTFEDWAFEQSFAVRTILNHFKIVTLSGFGIHEDNLCVPACGALLEYLQQTQKSALSNISSLKRYYTDDFMFLDISSRRNLEITATMRERERKGSLLWVLDKTKTSMGARLIRKWLEQPLLNIDDIEDRHAAVAEYKNDPILREDLKELLNTVYDIERLLSKISYKSANPRDLVALKLSFKHLPHIKNLLSGLSSRLNLGFYNSFDCLEDIHELIDDTIMENPPVSIKEGGFIKDGKSQELDSYREAREKGAEWIAQIEKEERDSTGIKSLKIKYNKVFGYHIEVTNSYLNLVPEHYIRRQTLSNCERFTISGLQEVEEKILKAEERINVLELDIFHDTVSEILCCTDRIQKTAHQLAQIDVLQSFAEAAEKNGYCRPEVTEGDEIDIKNGRHPVVEMLSKESFVPNDAFLNNSSDRLIILTGPNMAGKSTYMRQTALIVLMAQAGSFVPCDEAKIGICDRIFTRVGASDDLATGQSTFMVEMSEVANILSSATKRSLIILDEIGRGTSTYDGLSIAWAVLEHIADVEILGAKTLFSTHYHELTELEGKVDGVKNYCITVMERGDDIIFLRKIKSGGADNSYGIQVARLAGLPQSIISRSKDILTELNKTDIAKSEDSGTVYYGKATKKGKGSKIILNESLYQLLQELMRVDIHKITPIEALNYIHSLQEKAKEIE